MNLKQHPLGLTCVTLALASILSAGEAQKTTVSSGLVLTGVTIVDTHTGKLTPGMSVAIDGGKITRIGAQGSIVAKGSSQTIDAKGKYLVPGYWEMHAHPIDSPGRVDNLALMLANGVTGFRQMSGSDALLAERRAGTLMPATDAPELLAMPGSILLRGNAATIPMAIAEVDKQKGEGADFIKTIDVTPPVFFAALDEAKKQGLLYDGHLSPGVDAVKASEAGMGVIEHLGPMETILIGCSTDEAAIRQGIAKAAAAAAAQGPPPAGATALSKAATSDPVLMRAMADAGFSARTQHVLDTYSEERCKAVARVFAEHKTWQVPTLIRLRTSEFGDDPVYVNDPNLRYVDAQTRALWDGIGKRFTARMSPADKATLTQEYALQLKVAKLFADNGVKMLAGSDFGGIWLVAGFSLHQEFDQLAQAGFTPLQVLQMTTLAGAELLHREATDGTVEQGKNANLVLLDGDPMASVQNLHKVYAVVRDGSYYSKDRLEALKTKVQQHVALPSSAAPSVTPAP